MTADAAGDGEVTRPWVVSNNYVNYFRVKADSGDGPPRVWRLRARRRRPQFDVTAFPPGVVAVGVQELGVAAPARMDTLGRCWEQVGGTLATLPFRVTWEEARDPLAEIHGRIASVGCAGLPKHNAPPLRDARGRRLRQQPDRPECHSVATVQAQFMTTERAVAHLAHRYPGLAAELGHPPEEVLPLVWQRLSGLPVRPTALTHQNLTGKHLSIGPAGSGGAAGLRASGWEYATCACPVSDAARSVYLWMRDAGEPLVSGGGPEVYRARVRELLARGPVAPSAVTDDELDVHLMQQVAHTAYVDTLRTADAIAAERFPPGQTAGRTLDDLGRRLDQLSVLTGHPPLGRSELGERVLRAVAAHREVAARDGVDVGGFDEVEPAVDLARFDRHVADPDDPEFLPARTALRFPGAAAAGAAGSGVGLLLDGGHPAAETAAAAGVVIVVPDDALLRADPDTVERTLVAAAHRLRDATADDPDAFPVLVPPSPRAPAARAAAVLRDAVDRVSALPRFAGTDPPVVAVRVGRPDAGTVTGSSALERVPPSALLDVTEALTVDGESASRGLEHRLHARMRLARAARHLHRIDAAIRERTPADGAGPLDALRGSLPRDRVLTVARERAGDGWLQGLLYLPPDCLATRPRRLRVVRVRDEPATAALLPPGADPVLFLPHDADAAGAGAQAVVFHAAAAVESVVQRAFPKAPSHRVTPVGDVPLPPPAVPPLRRPSWYRGKPYTRVAQPGERVVVHQHLLDAVGTRPAADARGGFSNVYYLDLPWHDMVVSVPRRTAKHRASVLDPRIFVNIDDVHEAAWSQGVPTPPLNAYDRETDSFTIGRVHGHPLNAALRGDPNRQPSAGQVRDVVGLAARIGAVVLDPSLETVHGYPGPDAPELREHAAQELLVIHDTVLRELMRCADEGVPAPLGLYASLFPVAELRRFAGGLWGANRPAPVGLRHGDLHGENMFVPADPAAYGGAPLVAIDWGLARPQTLAFEIGRACHVLGADARTRARFEEAVAGAFSPRSPEGRYIASGEFSAEFRQWTRAFAMRTALGEILYSAQELARTPAGRYPVQAPRIVAALRSRMLRGARILDPDVPDDALRRLLPRALRDMAERYRTVVPLDSEVTWPSSVALPSIHPFGDSPGLRSPGPVRRDFPSGPPPRSRPSR
ncbi:hypothetical protein [Marinactinospora rubrisoli]|uniref:Aminoglycoside phosphotransferase domain-containing protein n=1 Tax=Marinactinospora rubrisoli TaxID=2715399 RepID=A0ABW2KJN8_9ACTN